MTVVQLKQRAACVNCGELGHNCDCGAPLRKAKKAIAENPGRSDEAIAEAIGVKLATVIKARKGKKRGRKKKPRPPKQLSACDTDWETYQEEGEPDQVMRARAVDWQLKEALRLVRDFALLRPGTKASEIRNKHIQDAVSISRAWKKLADALTLKQGGL
jgi:hypothetical protein